MDSFLLGSLALWILTHVITQELPTQNWPKPVSCPLCLTAWLCFSAAFYLAHWRAWDFGDALLIAGAIWGAVIFLDALYWRLRVTIL